MKQIALLLLGLLPLLSQAEVLTVDQEDHQWGLAMGIRSAEVPFSGADWVSDVIPLIQYEGKYGYLRGLQAGAYLWQNESLGLSAELHGRFRFVDLPKGLQNQLQADSFDAGLKLNWSQEAWQFHVAALADNDGRSYLNSGLSYDWQYDRLELTPYLELDWQSRRFNQYYYGFDQVSPGSGTSISGGVRGRWHLTDNLYLLAQGGVSRLPSELHDLPWIDSHYQMETFLGVGLFAPPKQRGHMADGDAFVRLAHGWATPSNLGDILAGNAKSDSYNNQMSSVFVGTQLTDSLFGLPLSLYFTPGLVAHHGSEVQSSTIEAIAAIKLFWTFELGPRWRFGVAEGLSYIGDVTYIEGSELEAKGYRPSRLLNYLDFSLEVNVGDLLKTPSLSPLWLGYSIHHRSGIFESSSMFGRIKGGSNYQSLTLQWHF